MSKHTHHNTHYLLLHLESWIENIPEDEVLICVSIALNYCVCHEEIKIKGYLITKSHVCLVVRSHKHSIHHVLTVLSEQIESNINGYIKVHNEEMENEKIVYLHNQYSMFTKHKLENDDLIQLITGEKVKLPYYSPKLARLKKLTYNYNYCSVINYRDINAIGPVEICR